MRYGIILLIATLLLSHNTNAKIVKTDDLSSQTILKPAASFTYERELFDALDLTELVYPINIQSNIGKGVTVETPVATNDISNFNVGEIGFTKLLDKDIIVSGSHSNPTVVIRVVEGDHGYDGQTESFTPTFTRTGRTDFIPEDAVYIAQTRAFYIGYRAPAADGKRSAVALVGMRFNDDNELTKYFELDVEEDDGFTIQNRLRLLVQQEGEEEFVVYMHDQHVGSAGDKPIEAKLRGFRVLGDAFDVETPLEIQNQAEALIEPVGFTSFRNQILVVSQRTDADKGVLCLTYVETSKDDDVLLMGPAQFTKVPSTGNLQVLESGHLISYSNQFIQISKLSHHFALDNWIGEVYQEFNATDANITLKGGMVSATEFDGDVVANFCDNTGGNHSHDTLLISARLDNAEIIKHGEGATVFNRMLFKIDSKTESFYHLDYPFIVINSDDLKDEVNEIQVKVWDSEMTEATAVVVSLTVFVLSEPFAEISTIPKPLEVTVFPDFLFENPFSRMDIIMGNQVNITTSSPSDVAGVESITMNSRDHKVNFTPELEDGTQFETLNIAPGALIFKNRQSDEIGWYQCYEQSNLETECARVGVTSAFTQGLLDISGSVLEVTYTVAYDAERDTSYLNWYQFDDEWEYEIYKGRILGVDHVEAQSGVVFMVIIFADHIKVTRFFDDWYYGSRDVQTYYHYDINSYEFCPVQVTADHADRSRIFVLSSCQDQQEIYQFSYDLEFVQFKYEFSRSIGTKLKAPELCVLPTEILIYSQISHQVFTIDYLFARTVSPVNLELLGLKYIRDFDCDPLHNIFTILTSDSEESESSDIVIFNGGREFNADNRVMGRFELESNFTSIQSFPHQDDVVFACWDQESEPYYHRVYLETPVLLSSFVSGAFNATDPFNISVVLANPGEEAVHRNHTVIPIALPNATISAVADKLKFQQGATVDITKAVSSFGSILGLRTVSSSLKRVDVGEGFEQAPVSGLQAFSYLEGPTDYQIDHREVGRFQRLETFDVVSYYTKASPLHYGVIDIMQGGKVFDSYYSLNSIRHSESIEASGSVFTVLLTNVGRLSDLSLIWAQGGKFNYHMITIDENNDYDSLRLFMVQEGMGTKDSPIEIGLIAHNRFTGVADLFKVVITTDEDDELDVIATNMATFKDPIKSFDIASRSKLVGFYYVSRSDELASMLFINKATYKFETAPASSLMSLQALTEERLASVSCEENSEETIERCVFSTYGALSIYTETIYKEGASAPEFKTFSLVRYGPYIGHSFTIIGRFIIQESDLLFKFEERKLLVWDINVLETRPEAERYLGTVTSVVNMRKPGSITSKYSKLLDSVILKDGSVELFLQAEDEETAQISVISKIVTPWSVKFGSQSWDQVKDLEIGFTFQEDDETLNLKISDIFDQ